MRVVNLYLRNGGGFRVWGSLLLLFSLEQVRHPLPGVGGATSGQHCNIPHCNIHARLIG